jgi:hypothetical protein
MNYLRLLIAASSLGYLSACTADEVHVTTQRYDNSRTGQNLSEKVLNTSNVNSARFGKLFTRTVDDEIYAQPLYVSNVDIPNRDALNVLYVATVNNTLYAFDADDPEANEPLWKVNLTSTMPGARPVKASDVGSNCGKTSNFTENIGIVGTPVIALESQTIYLVARTKERDRFVQRLYALDITTGAMRPSSPVVIEASTQGTGKGSSNGVIQFDPEIHNQRAALLLANGVVYIAWSSHCDAGPYHGWIMGYDGETLEQIAATVATPGGWAGGIWQSNSGPSADESGNIYLTTGNGTFTANKGGRDYGNAFLKMDPSLKVLDWFVPFNVEALNKADADLGSSGVLLIPNTNLLTSGGKKGGGQLYLLDRGDLGHFNSESDSQIVQSLTVGGGGLHGTPTYWEGPKGPHIYLWARNDVGKMYKLHEQRLGPEPVSKTKDSAKMPGGLLAVSANGAVAGSGILWAVTGKANAIHKSVPGVLRAFDAMDLSKEIWNSEQNAERDALGLMAKFNTPVVTNGKVYVATFSKQVAVYGLLSGPASR